MGMNSTEKQGAPANPAVDLADSSTWNTGVAETLEPLVRRVLAPNPSPYTFTGTGTYIIGAGDEVAVIDPGPNGTGVAGHADTKGDGHVEAILSAIGDARLVAILCTHTHRDHSPAAHPLRAATGAPVIGCAPLVIEDTGPRADAAFDPTYRPDRVLEDGETLSGAGWTLQAVATPGHTSNHLCYALRESGALFTGDHVMGWSTSVVSPPDGDMAAYMASLQKLHDREDRVYYPAHGPAIPNPRQFVRGMLGHRRQRERQIVTLLESAPRTIEGMVAAMYKGLDPRLHGAAGRSVLAHLIDLERQGRVARSGDVWTSLS
ncbi:metallo-beta-lactamase family protein [Novosphingobium sp. MD-1]|nr:metallo-beta-lactamase family protein [Novosphingobium sp. MD-1]